MTTRTAEQMMDLILTVAEENPRIRLVILNGSRANPNVANAIFQDFGMICVVDSLDPFLKDHAWIDVFGERMILQMPEDMELYPPAPELAGAFSYLMQFIDGNRIDLILVPLERLDHFLWRSGLIHAKELYNRVIHAALMQMLNWYIGCKHNFTVNPGKFGKYYGKYLDADHCAFSRSGPQSR